MKLFLSQVEDVLLQIEGIEPHYLMIVDHQAGVDTVQVQMEVSGALLTGDVHHLVHTQNLARQRLAAALGPTVEVKLVAPDPSPAPSGEHKEPWIAEKRKEPTSRRKDNSAI